MKYTLALKTIRSQLAEDHENNKVHSLQRELYLSRKHWSLSCLHHSHSKLKHFAITEYTIAEFEFYFCCHCKWNVMCYWGILSDLKDCKWQPCPWCPYKAIHVITLCHWERLNSPLKMCSMLRQALSLSTLGWSLE